MTKVHVNRLTALLAAAFAMLLAGGVSIGVWAQGTTTTPSPSRPIAHGGGVTIVEGGTGPTSGFVPVLTKIAFHVERAGQEISGGFECLALVPRTTTGAGSGEFTTNAMYVTGRVRTASVTGDTATITGMATITGLGAGTNVPFSFTFRHGGPGATAVLVTEGSPRLTFNEILVEGEFDVRRND